MANVWTLIFMLVFCFVTLGVPALFLTYGHPWMALAFLLVWLTVVRVRFEWK